MEELEAIERRLSNLRILRRNWPEFEGNLNTYPVRVRGQIFGGEKPMVIAGPCAVESFNQTFAIAKFVRDTGAAFLRGGAFKPRTRPSDFQGLGIEGLKILGQVRQELDIGIVTEVMDPRMIEITCEHADILQVGSRSMYNYPLLKEIGQSGKPVLLKRAWCATLEEWLCAAEYIAAHGSKDIILCERGIRTSVHWSYSRNTLDLNVIEPLRRLSPLPIIVDPSHASGVWKMVPNLSRAALEAGAQGLLIEVIESEPARGDLQCDREQGLPLSDFRKLFEDISNTSIRALIS